MHNFSFQLSVFIFPLFISIISGAAGPVPPADWVIEPYFDDATPDYDTDPNLIDANG